ncbi:PolC-type DNA polymerase III [Sungkyunkwania multivorans]|uniref:PolC-type DNA polymerase III n=1 Tax=Sungkyunkwania multivorans TaxID=1173618 RepID=A0ABW3CYS8_9FLAO
MFTLRKRKRSELPDFWLAYESHFADKKHASIDETRFVVLDTETTGFDFTKDRILSIGAVSVRKQTIAVADVFEVYILQDHFNPKTVEIHGILKEEKLNKVEELDALKMFLDYVKGAIIVAHHAYFDITMINRALKRHHLPSLKNLVMDTNDLYKRTRIATNLIDRDKNYSLDEICDALLVPLKDRHTAAGDAYLTAIAFLKIISKLKKGNRKLSLKKLLKK